MSLILAPGQSLCIMGPSGSGKSTLLYILGTLEPPTSGTVTLDGCDPFRLPEPELAAFRNRQVGFVFQDHCLLPQCSVLENVLAPTLVAKNRDGLVRCAVTGQAIECPGQQTFDDLLMETAGDHREAQTLRVELALERTRHCGDGLYEFAVCDS